MKGFVFGRSTKNVPILGYEFGSRTRPLLILGAHHGDEIEGTILCQGLIAQWLENYDYRLRTVIIPTLNIDGQLAGKRWNAQNVDLNRNLPTKDWTAKTLNPRYPPGPSPASEVETQALVRWIDEEKPIFILSLHSYHPMILENGACHEEAAVLHRFTGYEIREDVGHPTPGSLGTYGAHEKGIPTITFEIERGLPGNEILSKLLPAMNEFMKQMEKKHGY